MAYRYCWTHDTLFGTSQHRLLLCFEPGGSTFLTCLQHRLRYHAHAPPVRVIINPDGSGAALCSHYAAQTALHGSPSAAPTATTIALAREVKFKFLSFSWRTCIFAFLAALRAPIEVLFSHTRRIDDLRYAYSRYYYCSRNLFSVFPFQMLFGPSSGSRAQGKSSAKKKKKKGGGKENNSKKNKDGGRE